MAQTEQTFNAKTAKQLVDSLQKQFAALGEKHGFNIQIAPRTTYDSQVVNLKVSVAFAGVNPADVKAIKAWELYHESFGLPKKIPTKTFNHPKVAGKLKIIGLNPSARRFPVIVEEVNTGDRRSMPSAAALHMLGSKQ